MLYQLLPNKKECHCCGSIVDYPTEPGFWQFAEKRYTPDLYWIDVEIKETEEGLGIFLSKDSVDGSKGTQIWWPEARWRKSK